MAGTPRRVRMKDVAARAGVSTKTVSNVVNGSGAYSSATRQRILEAMDALGYRLNVNARSLRIGRSGIIMLALPELAVPYFAELAELVIGAAERHGSTVIIDQTNGLRSRELAVLDARGQGRIDGLIMNPLHLTADDLAGGPDDVPIVLLGECGPLGGSDSVAIDNVAAARAMTHHLISTGRRRIAVIGAGQEPHTGTAQQRLRGYREALREAGLGESADLVQPVQEYHRADGAAAADRLLGLPTPPDAIFCFNDLLAVGAIRALLDRGVAIPDDIAVAGFDDTDESAYCAPRLTTVAPDKPGVAAEAVRLLHERIGGGPRTERRSVEIAFRLHVRESTLGRDGRRPGSVPSRPTGHAGRDRCRVAEREREPGVDRRHSRDADAAGPHR